MIPTSGAAVPDAGKQALRGHDGQEPIPVRARQVTIAVLGAAAGPAGPFPLARQLLTRAPAQGAHHSSGGTAS